jgi:2-dehydropantoate 2-reductase
MARAVGRGRGGKMPSLHIDLHSGRGRSEVGWLNGAVLRHGEALGVDTPVNRVLYATLSGLMSGDLDTGEFSKKPAKLLAELD